MFTGFDEVYNIFYKVYNKCSFSSEIGLQMLLCAHVCGVLLFITPWVK